LMLLSGVSSLVCSSLLKPALKTLTMVMLAPAFPQFRLMQKDAAEFSESLILFFFTPLMVLGVVSTGLHFELDPLAAAPCALITLYATWLSDKGIRRKMSQVTTTMLLNFLFFRMRSLIFLCF
ncbi:hypothetical protein PENTCL1PPCAC_29143, partial [Pristionchus entomophagus]